MRTRKCPYVVPVLSWNAKAVNNEGFYFNYLDFCLWLSFSPTICTSSWIAICPGTLGVEQMHEPCRPYPALLYFHLCVHLFLLSLSVFGRDIYRKSARFLLSFLTIRLENICVNQFSSSSCCPHYLQWNQGKAEGWIKIDSVPWLFPWSSVHLHQGVEWSAPSLDIRMLLAWMGMARDAL